ncbi:MAG: ABC transporter permease [Lachnospiraceae bacterium]|nr:ABC transporter permease [Lachnospiraceae bacterium]
MGAGVKKGNAFTNNPIVKTVGTQKIVVIGVIIFLAIFFSWMSPAFRQYSTVVSIFDFSYYVSLMAIGVTFPLITGGVDLSIGTGMVAAGLFAGNLVNQQNLPVGLALLVCILFGVALGCLNAFSVAKLNLPPFIATLSSMMIARGLGSILVGGMSVTWPAGATEQGWFRSIFRLDANGTLIPVGFILILALVIVMSVFLNHSRPGRYIISVGSNKEAARLSGIHVAKWHALAYIISGFFTGLAGVAYAATFQGIVPGTGAGLELDAIAGVIIGGTSMKGGYGTIGGTLLGVFVMSLLKTGLPFIGLQANWQQIITGIVLIIAVFIDVTRNAKK